MSFLSIHHDQQRSNDHGQRVQAKDDQRRDEIVTWMGKLFNNLLKIRRFILLLTQVSFHLAVNGRLHVNRYVKGNWVVAHVDAKLPHKLLKVIEHCTLHVHCKDKVGVVRVETNLAVLNVNLIHLTTVHVNVATGECLGKVVRKDHCIVRLTSFHRVYCQGFGRKD